MHQDRIHVRGIPQVFGSFDAEILMTIILLMPIILMNIMEYYYYHVKYDSCLTKIIFLDFELFSHGAFQISSH